MSSDTAGLPFWIFVNVTGIPQQLYAQKAPPFIAVEQRTTERRPLISMQRHSFRLLGSQRNANPGKDARARLLFLPGEFFRVTVRTDALNNSPGRKSSLARASFP